jgi:hypothetical protein
MDSMTLELLPVIEAYAVFVSQSALQPIPVSARSKRGSAAARLLRLWVRIAPGAWMSVSCECCLLSGTELCVGMITVQRSPTECGVSECDRVASIMGRP